MDQSLRAKKILHRLSKLYPNPAPALNWHTPWELLVATVLSAQCTDERVNQVTPVFFKRWPSPEHLTLADLRDVETAVRTAGLYRNKSKHLIQTATILVDRHHGHVPQTMPELLDLPGLGRKTANIILSNAFQIFEGIAVDTHVKRIAFRLGLTKATNPKLIEEDLMPLFPQKSWGDINHMLVFFGRSVCEARKPFCSQCVLNDICPREGVKKA